MPKYEDQIDNESRRSFDNVFEGVDIPMIRTNGVKKFIASANEKLRRFTRKKTPFGRFGYDEEETFSEAAKDP